MRLFYFILGYLLSTLCVALVLGVVCFILWILPTPEMYRALIAVPIFPAIIIALMYNRNE